MTVERPRLALAAEAASLLEMLVAAREDIGLAARFDNSAPYQQWMHQACDGERVWVVGQSGRVQAMVVLGNRDSAAMNLSYLVVSAEYRRRGLGESLVQHLQSLEHALRAEPRNSASAALLAKLGFIDDPHLTDLSGHKIVAWRSNK
jgi:ribosomal protein S18 acetylase RimI-like enzyme